MGELMLRLSPPGYERFVQANSLQVTFGGGEANVAAALSQYGHDVYFVTKLPKHDVGQAAINHLQRYGIKSDYVVRGGDRIGIYFLEKGASMRPSRVIYDRAGSAISEAEVHDFAFDEIFRDVDWFHFTSITPALGEKAFRLTLAALKAAKKNGVTISLDMNYRKKLWSVEEAADRMLQLMPYVDVFIGNAWDVENILKMPLEQFSNEKEKYQAIFKKMQEAFGIRFMITTNRVSHSASDNSLSARIYNEHKFYESKTYDMHIVDRVGGGDAFAGAMIHGILDEHMDEKMALEFAVAASALKHTVEGDFNIATVEEIMTLVEGDSSGRVQR